jgi:putative transposase
MEFASPPSIPPSGAQRAPRVGRCCLGGLQSQAALHLENLALRHQLGVLGRSVKRPKPLSADRLLWAWLCEFWSDWRSVLVIVKPETVIAWHREGFRLFWTWKVPRGQPGRPPVSKDVRELIRKMSREIRSAHSCPAGVRHAFTANCSNSASTSVRPAWASTSYASGNRRRRLGGPFLENHVKTMVSVDFFTVPTIRFQVLNVFLVLSHNRRRIVHFNVTADPTAEWTGQQLREALPFEVIYFQWFSGGGGGS